MRCSLQAEDYNGNSPSTRTTGIGLETGITLQGHRPAAIVLFTGGLPRPDAEVAPPICQDRLRTCAAGSGTTTDGVGCRSSRPPPPHCRLRRDRPAGLCAAGVNGHRWWSGPRLGGRTATRWPSPVRVRPTGRSDRLGEAGRKGRRRRPASPQPAGSGAELCWAEAIQPGARIAPPRIHGPLVTSRVFRREESTGGMLTRCRAPPPGRALRKWASREVSSYPRRR